VDPSNICLFSLSDTYNVVRFQFKNGIDRNLVVRFRLSPKPSCELKVVSTQNLHRYTETDYWDEEEYASQPTDRICTWLGGDVEGVGDVEDVDTNDWLLGVEVSIRPTATKVVAPRSAERSALGSNDYVLSLSRDSGYHILSDRTLDEELAARILDELAARNQDLWDDINAKLDSLRR
jgi:hypothetical protein